MCPNLFHCLSDCDKNIVTLELSVERGLSVWHTIGKYLHRSSDWLILFYWNFTSPQHQVLTTAGTELCSDRHGDAVKSGAEDNSILEVSFL